MKLKDSPKIIKKAKDLGLKRFSDPERAIRSYCLKRVKSIFESFGEIKDLNQLLDVVSSNLKMRFEEVHDDTSLIKIAEKYLAKGELFFSNLHKN